MMRISSLGVPIGAVLLALGAGAAALPSLYANGRPEWVAALWPTHPAVLTDQGMRAIGQAAADGQAIPAQARAQIGALASRRPLAAEPFLIEGTMAQTAGDTQRAQTLFEAARARDPRSPAARYFLAERYLSSGAIDRGLRELIVLTRIAPGGSGQIAPALAAFARTPGAIPSVKRFLRSAPAESPQVLALLAADAANRDLVLDLAGTPPAPGAWRAILVEALLARGAYASAFATWRRLGGTPAQGGLVNPGFADMAAPPPFNWTYENGSAGLVEPTPGGRLQLVYYGRAEAVLAGQTLLLEPGAYRLSYRADAGSPAVRWRFSCRPGALLLSESALVAGAGSAAFVVPSTDCRAQQIELRGFAGDTARTTELTVGGLRLTREAAR